MATILNHSFGAKGHKKESRLVAIKTERHSKSENVEISEIGNSDKHINHPCVALRHKIVGNQSSHLPLCFMIGNAG